MTLTTAHSESERLGSHDVRRLIARLGIRPQAPAVLAPDATLTYGELQSQALEVARQLVGFGVRPGDKVALCAPRSAALVVGALGILAAGGVYVALDPLHPSARLRLLVERVGASFVVASAAHPVDLGSTVTTLEIDASAAHLVVRPDDLPLTADAASHWMAVVDLDRPTSPDDPAYVVFTSGSTGTPKGVLVSHGGLANLIRWHVRAFGLTSADRTTHIASPAFDASVWEIWPTLVAGAALHIPPDDVRIDPVALRDWLVEREVTVSFLPTALCEQMLALEWPADAALRFLLTGGDALHQRPRPGLPFQLVNNYGVSEASVVSTSTVVEALAGNGPEAAPPIGSAIDGVSLLVVDELLQPVADAEPGELLIGGVSVALGYLDEPELSARSFISRSGPDGTTMRYYRTGDLVRSGPGGRLQHLGRLDEQVQIRGARVELGEVAAVLDCHPQVEASAAAMRGSHDQLRLIAYVVPTDPEQLSTQNLVDYAAGQLPAHMVPTAIVIVAALPATDNGKLDRRALPEPSPLDRVLPSRPELDVTDTEEGDVAAADPQLVALVSGLVCELLDLPEVDARDNFFLLGGHSLLGAQLLARLDVVFGVEMPLRELFQFPTVADIAVYVEEALVADLDHLTDAEAEALVRAPEAI